MTVTTSSFSKKGPWGHLPERHVGLAGQHCMDSSEASRRQLLPICK